MSNNVVEHLIKCLFAVCVFAWEKDLNTCLDRVPILPRAWVSCLFITELRQFSYVLDTSPFLDT